MTEVRTWGPRGRMVCYSHRHMGAHQEGESVEECLRYFGGRALDLQSGALEKSGMGTISCVFL